MTDEQWQAAWKIYQSASTIRPEQAVSILNSSTDDPEVQAAVHSLLSGTQKVERLDRIGQRIGRYVVTGRLGQGGMGEVYAARDIELDRSVAVKLLNQPAFGTSYPVDRFIREAKAASALNHPNIVTIYEVIHSESRLSIVMELVDGMAFRKLCGSPLPVDRVLHLGEQAARALAAAHARGIVHCDIKPENLMVRPDGIVKVLDFGLARDLASVTTGSLLAAGTLRYMSPEQSRGEEPSAASDIFSLGIVLYELTAGIHPFDSGSIFEGLKALNQAEPPAPSSVNSFVPPNMDDLILKMLAKAPDMRPPAATVAQLLGSRFQSDPAFVPAPRAPEKNLRVWRTDSLWKTAAAVFAIISAISFWAPWRGPAQPLEQSSLRLALDLGPAVSLGSAIGPAVILSPDGTRMAYVSQGADGIRRLFSRRLDQPKATQLPGTEGAATPFFSPDGQWLGFFALGKLKKTRIDGGNPVALCDAPSGRGASWSDDGNIVVALDQQAGLSQVPPEGGKVIPVTNLNLERGEFTHRWPQVLPGGKSVLFAASISYGNWNDADIMAVSLADHRTKTVLAHAGTYPRYVPGGYLVYVNKGVLFAVRFDPERLEARGNARQLWEVASNAGLGSAQFDFARNGTLAYQTSVTEGLWTMNWLGEDGKILSLGTGPASYLFPRLSPDGNRLAYTIRQSSSQDLWIRDLQRGANTRLTGESSSPVWTPDGRFVVFQALGGMFWTRSDGAGKPQPLTESKAIQLPASFTADGARLVFAELVPGAGGEIRTIAVENDGSRLRAAGKPQVFLKTPTLSTFPAFSPDGRWLAYADSEAGEYEVYVRSFPDKGTQVQISNAGGSMPVWSRNGHDLFYRTADQRLMVVNYVAKGDSFQAGKPRVWFAAHLAGIGLGQNFDLAPDRERFLVLMPAESSEPREAQNHVMIATNFFEEVRRRLAGAGN